MVGTNQGVLWNWCQLHCLSANFKTHHATLFKGKDMFMVYACTAKFIQRKRDNGEPPAVSRIMDQVLRKVTISTEFLLHHRKQPFCRSGHVALGVILGPEVYNIRFVELHRLRGQYRFKRRVGQRSRS